MDIFLFLFYSQLAEEFTKIGSSQSEHTMSTDSHAKKS